jgi:hypothetical protein
MLWYGRGMVDAVPGGRQGFCLWFVVSCLPSLREDILPSLSGVGYLLDWGDGVMECWNGANQTSKIRTSKINNYSTGALGYSRIFES